MYKCRSIFSENKNNQAYKREKKNYNKIYDMYLMTKDCRYLGYWLHLLHIAGRMW